VREVGDTHFNDGINFTTTSTPGPDSTNQAGTGLCRTVYTSVAYAYTDEPPEKRAC
jgi:hypothetical protein